jgi:hypothetical protein
MIVNCTSKWIALMIAFALQSRISAIQSAAMGGQIFARSLLQLGRERGLVNVEADETYMDEVVGWSVAVIGTSKRAARASSADTLSKSRRALSLTWNILSSC